MYILRLKCCLTFGRVVLEEETGDLCLELCTKKPQSIAVMYIDHLNCVHKHQPLLAVDLHPGQCWVGYQAQLELLRLCGFCARVLPVFFPVALADKLIGTLHFLCVVLTWLNKIAFLLKRDQENHVDAC